MASAQHAMRVGLASVVACSFFGLASVASAGEVTSERLLKAANEPQNWLLPFGSYDAHYNSNLSQINRSNVGDLKLLFLHAIGGTNPSSEGGNPNSQQAMPVVEDGFLYVQNPWSEMLKIDVRTGTRGQTLWINDPEMEAGGAMRGSPALLGNYVYNNTRDARLIKIDAQSGETVWEVSTLAPEPATPDQRHTVQPIAIKNQLVLATTGGGKRGWVGAFNADDGAFMWRFFTIAGPGEPGFETWADDWNAWATGGAGVWTQGSYDPETNLVMYGTGDAAPWHDPAFRPGDNLYTVSVVAVDADTGELGWYFQEIPNESFDYDTVNSRMLYDITVDGKVRKVAGTFSRNGFYYTLDRTTGAFLFAEPYAPIINWTAGLDPKTGMPVEYDPNKLLQTYANNKTIVPGDPLTAQNICPVFLGAPTMMPPTFDRTRMRAYVGGKSGCWDQTFAEPYEKADIWRGKRFAGRETTYYGKNGRIDVVDVRTGMKVMEATTQYPIYSGLLGTAGDLIFVGHLDGKVSAYDKDTLAELWAYNVGTPISGPAITYMVNGKQYVAMIIGGQHRFTDVNPELAIYKRSGNLAVFGL